MDLDFLPLKFSAYNKAVPNLPLSFNCIQQLMLKPGLCYYLFLFLCLSVYPLIERIFSSINHNHRPFPPIFYYTPKNCENILFNIRVNLSEIFFVNFSLFDNFSNKFLKLFLLNSILFLLSLIFLKFRKKNWKKNFKKFQGSNYEPTKYSYIIISQPTIFYMC